MNTNYETLRDEILKDPEMRAKYFLASEKLNIDLMIDSVKESLKKGQQIDVVMRKLNRISNYLNKLAI